MALSVQRELVAQLTVPLGSHVYASPAPEGIVAVDIEIDANPLLVLRDIVRPPSETHSLSGTAETFQVHHGQLALRLPVTINGMVTGAGNNNEIVIAGTVRWQSCDDEVCDLPGEYRFEIKVPVEAPVIPQIRVPDAERTIEPRAGEHFQHMVNRHKESL
ncbi:protein-disulfide reductase DsbD N-terminal domain-containing protein [Pseudomonadales bacterium]|nr:protein-disulfide reductase DsbD N-terminal domain-containing protein [Pseudomonadales bacterium]MDC0893660.1 protein-disulfide reductase DsbD family protein [Pseudomonadales bacterium]